MRAASYLIGLGSNRRHGRFGAPDAVVRAAAGVLEARVLSTIVTSPPLGPGRRRYANAVAVIDSALSPPAMLVRLKAVERGFGRRSGRRWGDRVLDLDIVAWSGGGWRARGLVVPHAAASQRAFVLWPAARVAGAWRIGPKRIRHLAHGLARPR